LSQKDRLTQGKNVIFEYNFKGEMNLLETQKSGNKASLRTVGGSVMVAIPPALLDLLGFRPNAKVALSVDHGRLVIEPAPKPSYTLTELVSQCDPEWPSSVEDQDWLDAPAIGREEL
jgi:antitoxin ChpS